MKPNDALLKVIADLEMRASAAEAETWKMRGSAEEVSTQHPAQLQVRDTNLMFEITLPIGGVKLDNEGNVALDGLTAEEAALAFLTECKWLGADYKLALERQGSVFVGTWQTATATWHVDVRWDGEVSYKGYEPSEQTRKFFDAFGALVKRFRV